MLPKSFLVRSSEFSAWNPQWPLAHQALLISCPLSLEGLKLTRCFLSRAIVPSSGMFLLQLFAWREGCFSSFRFQIECYASKRPSLTSPLSKAVPSNPAPALSIISPYLVSKMAYCVIVGPPRMEFIARMSDSLLFPSTFCGWPGKPTLGLSALSPICLP